MVVVALVGLSVLIVSSGAFAPGEPVDRIDDDVVLQPSNDSAYAFLNDDDELVIDISEENEEVDGDGVNADAFTGIDEVFYVKYEGDANASVWLSHDVNAVSFVVDGEPIDDEDDAILLTPEDDVVAVGIEVDARVAEVEPGAGLIEEVGVHARIAEDDDDE